MISVIVPCRNRLKKITMCLDSINKALDYYALKNTKVEYEIIIVNDHSDVGFKKELLNNFPEIIIVDSDGVGPGYARNLGIKSSRGKYLFFTDSDCVVSEDWIYQGMQAFRNNDLVIQGIPWLFQKNENIYLGTQEEKLYEIMFKSYLYGKNLTHMTDSRNLLINKDIVKILGDEVFAESMTKAAAESRVFGKRCNSKGIIIQFNENVRIFHEDSLDMESVCRQKYRHGSGRVEIWENTPSFSYLQERYFDNPIKNGIDVEYILPAHFAFLLGYFQTLNEKDTYNSFIQFSERVFNKYNHKITDFNYLIEMVNEKQW